MLGSGFQAICILIDLNTALANCNIIIPTVQERSECEIAQGVSNILVPGDHNMVGFEAQQFLPQAHS
jgi:hypothetical protein